MDLPITDVVVMCPVCDDAVIVGYKDKKELRKRLDNLKCRKCKKFRVEAVDEYLAEWESSTGAIIMQVHVG